MQKRSQPIPFVVWLTITARLVVVAAFLLWIDAAPHSIQIERWWHIGEQAAHEGHDDDALAAYNRALDCGAPPPAIYERLVQMKLETGQYDQARMYLYALADRDGWNVTRRNQLTTILEHSGELGQTSALLRGASLAEDQPNPAALRYQAEQQIEQLDWPGARETLEQLIVQQPTDAWAFYQLGMLLAPEDQALAAEYLDRAAANPDWAAYAETVRSALAGYERYALTDAHTLLGMALVGLGEWPFAERALVMALQANAVNPAALAYVGFARDQQGRDGLPDIEAALAMAPNDPTVYFILGQHWRLVGEYEQSYDVFTQAYWLAPGNPALAAEVGTSLQLLGDLSAAEEWLRIAVELAPDDVRWHTLLAAFYADTGYQLESGEGLVFIQGAVELAPDDPDLHASLGWAYYQIGEFSQAYDELNIAVGLDARHPRSRYYFAIVLEYLGDREGATDSYRFVVETVGAETGYGLLAARALERLGYAPP